MTLLSARTLVGLLALAATAALAAACDGGAEHRFVAEKAIHMPLGAGDIKLLDLRFKSADLRVRQTDEPEIFVDGKVFVTATDRDAAELHAAAIELEVVAGRFTRIALPDSPAGYDCKAELEVAVPRGLSLQALVGDGEIRIAMDPPLKTDIQLDRGLVDVEMPPGASAFVHAECNVGEVFVEGFDRIDGTPTRQFTKAGFTGSIGSPVALVGSRLEVRVNLGPIVLHAPGAGPSLESGADAPAPPAEPE